MESLVINEEFKKEREVVKRRDDSALKTRPMACSPKTFWLPRFKSIRTNIYPSAVWKISIGQLCRCAGVFDTFYVPNNATLVIVGDFEATRRSACPEAFWPPAAQQEAGTPFYHNRAASNSVARIHKNVRNVPLPAIVSAFHLPPGGPRTATLWR